MVIIDADEIMWRRRWKVRFDQMSQRIRTLQKMRGRYPECSEANDQRAGEMLNTFVPDSSEITFLQKASPLPQMEERQIPIGERDFKANDETEGSAV